MHNGHTGLLLWGKAAQPEEGGEGQTCSTRTHTRTRISFRTCTRVLNFRPIPCIYAHGLGPVHLPIPGPIPITHIEFVVMFIINLTGLPLRVRGCTEEGADL